MDRISSKKEALTAIGAAKFEWDATDIYKKLPDNLKKDMDIARAAVDRWPSVYGLLPEEIARDKNLMNTALGNLGPTLCAMPDDIRNDKESVSRAMSHTPGIITCASDEVRNDREFILGEVRKSGEAYRWIPKSLKGDEQIATAAVQAKPKVISDVPEEIREKVRDLVNSQMPATRKAACSVLSTLKLDYCSDIEALKPTPHSQINQNVRER